MELPELWCRRFLQGRRQEGVPMFCNICFLQNSLIFQLSPWAMNRVPHCGCKVAVTSAALLCRVCGLFLDQGILGRE